MKGMSGKKAVILIVAVLGAALIAWVVLIAGILKNDKKPSKQNQDKPVKEEVEKEPTKKPEPEPDKDKLYTVYRLTGAYDVSGGEEIPEETRKYDKDGNLTNRSQYADGLVYCSIDYEYDKNGNMTLHIEHDADGNLNCRYDYMYDAEGREIRMTFSNRHNAILYVTETEYYGNGNPKTKSTLYTEVSDFPYKSEIESYDEAGNPTESVTVYTNGSVLKKVSEYDDQNRLRKEVLYSDESEQNSAVYEYADDRIVELHYTYSELTSKTVRNINGDILESYEYVDGAPCLTQQNQYDSLKNIILRTNYDKATARGVYVEKWDYNPDGQLLSYKAYWVNEYGEQIESTSEEYKYDEAGVKTQETVTYSTLDGDIYSTTEHYYQNGREISAFGYNAVGDKTMECHFDYDENGNVISSSEWNRGEDRRETAYRYQRFELPYDRLSEDERKTLGLTEQGK